MFIKSLLCFYVLTLQNCIQLKKMQQEGRACFPSCTKLSGTKAALQPTLKAAAFGAQLKQHLKINCGAFAQPAVSTATKFCFGDKRETYLQCFLKLFILFEHFADFIADQHKILANGEE